MSAKANAGKLKKRMDRARRKGRATEALELARELCALTPDDAAAWISLAEIADDEALTEQALDARFEAAKLQRAGTDDWTALAKRARDGGAQRHAAEAYFRAGDQCATAGQLQRAIELLELALQCDAAHHPAQRVRQLLLARLLPSEAELAPQPASTTTLSADALAERELRDGPSALRDRQLFDSDAIPDENWSPPIGDVESDIGATPVGYALSVQPWPSVLDDTPLLLVGELSSINARARDAIDALCEPLQLRAGEPLAEQGHAGEVLYVLERGRVAISRARPDARELGVIPPGHFFGEVGASVGLVNTTSLRAQQDCQLRVVTRGKLKRRLTESLASRSRNEESAAPLVDLLRRCALEHALQRCPLLQGADIDLWRGSADDRLVSYRAGARILVQGVPSDDLLVIVTGFAHVSVASDSSAVGSTLRTFLPASAPVQRLGYVCPGDLIGELSATAPSVSVTAQVPTTALRISRDEQRRLPEPAREALALRAQRQSGAIAFAIRRFS